MRTIIPNRGRIFPLLTFICSAVLITTSILNMRPNFYFFAGIVVLLFNAYFIVRLGLFKNYLVFDKGSKTLTVNKLLYTKKIGFDDLLYFKEVESIFRSGIVIFGRKEKVIIVKPFIEAEYDLFLKELGQIIGDRTR